ncbi:MAG: YecA family protein [Opitutaceae bacterium]
MDFTTPTIDLFTKGLSHSDSYVRNECLRYISRHPSRSIEHSREVLSQLALHGLDFYEYAYLAKRLPLDSSTIEQLFELCLAAGMDEDEGEMGARYLPWSTQVEPEYLHEVLEKLDTPGLPDHKFAPLSLIRLRVTEGIRISKLSEQETHKELHQVQTEMLGAEYLRTDLVQLSKHLCRQLIRITPHDRIVALAKKWLHFDQEYTEPKVEDWQLSSGIYLCGLLQLKDEAPRLVKLFDEDWELWNEEIEYALIAMDSPDAFEYIQAHWSTIPEHGKLYLSNVYEELTPAGYDTFYRQILDNREDRLHTTIRFARALAHSGNKEALDAVQTYIEAFDPMYPEALELAKTIYAHYKLRSYQPNLAGKIEQRLTTRDDDRLERLLLNTERLPTSLPIHKEAKIGRNDPCPCGSGKKYKKCCL